VKIKTIEKIEKLKENFYYNVLVILIEALFLPFVLFTCIQALNLKGISIFNYVLFGLNILIFLNM